MVGITLPMSISFLHPYNQKPHIAEPFDLIYSDIIRYLHDAEQISLQKAGETARNSDSRNYYAAYMVEFALINRMLDLARCCVYSCGYAGQNEVLKNKVLIKRLEDVGVIDEYTKQELLLCIDRRNQISHHFRTCTYHDLVQLYKKNEIMRQCAEQWREHIKTHEQKHDVRVAGVVAAIFLLVLTFFLLY
ncbi:MAG: hypothetical protein LBV40_01170 [Methanomicrobiales archaeon]|jgi:uncharacterized protein YutE (UPF0331/DUF86 family)|nr:hypothetical protein [Methanomicrobiales archaeon]